MCSSQHAKSSTHVTSSSGHARARPSCTYLGEGAFKVRCAKTQNCALSTRIYGGSGVTSVVSNSIINGGVYSLLHVFC